MSGLVRTCAAMTCLLGLALGGFGVAAGVRAIFPAPLFIALILGGALLVGLGIGLVKRQRQAWSFSVAALGVLGVSGLLAIPALVRAGLPATVGVIALAVVLGILGALIAGREAF